MIIDVDERDELERAFTEIKGRCPNAHSRLAAVFSSVYKRKVGALLYQVSTEGQLKYHQGICQLASELKNLLEAE